MEKKRIVFLYTEIATYFLACIEKLALQPNVEITVIRWPLNKEAPFNFSFSPSIAFYTRNDFTADEKSQPSAAYGASCRVIYSVKLFK